MKLNTARAKQLDGYLETQVRQASTDEKIKISYGGELHTQQVYKIPLRYLVYNIRNGRFRAELLEKEEELHRRFNPADKLDEQIIKTLLLNQDKNATEILKADLKKHGQIDPGIITFDGAVINANRRMAILSVLFDETRDTKFSYLRVARLPQGVDEPDIWRIEAGLQFAKDFRLDYAGINELLKLKEGIKEGLTPKDISVALQGRFSAKKVKEKLEILKLIESHLEFTGKKEEYFRIQEDRDLEKFNSLQANVIAPLLTKHNKTKAEIAKLTTLGFAVIEKTGLTHWDIRDLRKIALNRKASNKLMNAYPSKAPSKVADFRISEEHLTDIYKTAQEVVKDQEDEGRPEKLLTRALSALESINHKSPKLKEQRVKELLKSISARLVELEKHASRRP